MIIYCLTMFFFNFSAARAGTNSSSNNLPDVAPVATVDTQWLEVTSKKAALKLEQLDTELKSYKSNSIKESVRSVFFFSKNIMGCEFVTKHLTLN